MRSIAVNKLNALAFFFLFIFLLYIIASTYFFTIGVSVLIALISAFCGLAVLLFISAPNLILFLSSSFLCLLAIDAALIVFDSDLIIRKANQQRADQGQVHDIPVIPYHVYFETDDGFRVAVHEKNYNETYFGPGQVASYLDNEEILEYRHQNLITDELGLRNPPGSSKLPIDVLLMGDSFAFGYGVDQPRIWSEILRQSGVSSVYNMGVYGNGTSHQVELLKHLIESEKIRFGSGPREVFFLIFEGNDFNQSSVYHQNTKMMTLRETFKQIRQKVSIFRIRQLIAAQLRRAEQGPGAQKHFNVLASDQFEPAAFSVGYTNDAISNNTGVMSATIFERSKISQSLKRLKSIAATDLTVTILYLPTRARVYGKYYRNHPVVPPDLMKNHLKKAAEDVGFNFFDLTGPLRDRAEKGQMVYWRDDTHLNELGHAILAEKVSEILAQ